MANENFGLSFTVLPLALWNEYSEGSMGEAGTLYVDLVTQEKIGEAGTFFIDLVAQEKIGEASTFDAIDLCSTRSILEGALRSTLSGLPRSDLSCG